MIQRIALGLGLAVFILLGPVQPLSAQVDKEVFEFDGFSKGQPIKLSADLFFPKNGAGKFPAMMILHGSGGATDEREYEYARQFSKLGVASIIPDSFTGRGVKSTVNDQAAVPSIEIASDAMKLLAALAQHPRIDISRVGVVGFSKGATAALQISLAAQADRHVPSGPRFTLHAAFYPACDTQYLNVKTTGAPIRVLIGGADTYVGSQPCLDYAAKIKAGGADIQAIVYPRAPHDWDVSKKPWTNSAGENHSKCVFLEQSDRSWVEQTSGITIIGPGGRPIAGARDQAYAKCRSYGVSGGPDFEAKEKSLAELLSFVKHVLKL